MGTPAVLDSEKGIPGVFGQRKDPGMNHGDSSE
jgi:hypothetical protein